jgi:hypothetical protein
MKLPIPGLDAVLRLVACLRQQVQIAVTLLPRTGAMLTSLEAMTVQVQLAAVEGQVAIDRAGRLLDSYEKPLTELGPTVDRIAQTMSPEEFDALKDFLDQLRLTFLQDLLPLLRQVRRTGPDLTEVMESMEGLGRGLRGLMLGMTMVQPRSITVADGTTPAANRIVPPADGEDGPAPVVD